MAKKMVIPWELKYDSAMKAWASNHRGFLYAIREKYGAAAALEIYERAQKIDNRVKTFTDTIRTVFNIEGNDASTIGEVLDVFDEIIRTEYAKLERSPTINRRKVTKCPFKTGYNDISDWSLTFFNIVGETINPKATLERPKGMCAGDPYCEYIWRLDKSTHLKGAVEFMANERVISSKLKYDFAIEGWVTNHIGHLYALREKYGSAAALDMYERFCRMGDRIKNLVNTLKTIFKIEGNDVKAFGELMDIWHELVGIEFTVSERSKAIDRILITKCPHKTEFKDISDWDYKIFTNMFAKAINPKIIVELTKNMCAGDPYCEHVAKLEE